MKPEISNYMREMQRRGPENVLGGVSATLRQTGQDQRDCCMICPKCGHEFPAPARDVSKTTL